MTDLEKAVRAAECGLLLGVRIKGRPQQRMKLRERKARYSVLGFSIALIEGDEMAWTKG